MNFFKMIIDDAVILKEQKEQERKEKAELRNGFQKKILEQSFLIGHELSTNQNYFIRKPFKGVVLRLCKC